MVVRRLLAKSGISLLLLSALLLYKPSWLFATATATPATGTFLVAAEKLADPRFQQAVILLLQHGKEGSVGLIVNKPLQVSLGHAIPGLPDETFSEQPLYFGGPVSPRTAWALFTGVGRTEDAVAILPGVFVANVDRFFADRELPGKVTQLKILSGYAGWAPGQLAKEVERGDWKVTPARAAEIFDADPGSLWEYLSGQGAVLI